MSVVTVITSGIKDADNLHVAIQAIQGGTGPNASKPRSPVTFTGRGGWQLISMTTNNQGLR